MGTVASALEKAKLLELDGNYRDLCSRFQAFTSRSPHQTLQELDAFVAHLREWTGILESYDETATCLQALGRPQFSERLSAAKSHVEQMVQCLQSQRDSQQTEVAGIFKEMTEDSAERQRKRGEIVRDTRREVSRIQQETAERTREVHNAMTERWRTAFRGDSPPSPGCGPGTTSSPTYQPTNVPESNAAASVPSHCHKVCPVCGKWCLQPPSHAGKCRCENNHEGFW